MRSSSQLDRNQPDPIQLPADPYRSDRCGARLTRHCISRLGMHGRATARERSPLVRDGIADRRHRIGQLGPSRKPEQDNQPFRDGFIFCGVFLLPGYPRRACVCLPAECKSWSVDGFPGRDGAGGCDPCSGRGCHARIHHANPARDGGPGGRRTRLQVRNRFLADSRPFGMTNQN